MDKDSYENAELVDTPDKYGRIPIHVACEAESDQSKLIQLIDVYKHAVPKPNNYTRMLALHYACSNPNINAEVISLLLKHYKDAVKVVDREKNLPIHYACKNKGIKSDVIELLLQAYEQSSSISDGNGKYPIHLASANSVCGENVIKILVASFPKAVSIQEPEGGNVPLHYIVNSDQSIENVNKLRILLSADKEASNAINKETFTPLMIAERDGKLRFLMYLWGIIPLDQEIKIKSDRGFFWKAMRAANSNIVLACLRKDSALLNDTTKNGERPLQMSIRLGYKNLFDLLIDQITKQEKFKHLLSEPDKAKNAYTPLQLAIKHIRSDFMATLLSMKEVVKGAEKDKLKMLSEAVKTQDKGVMITIINAFQWPNPLRRARIEKEEREARKAAEKKPGLMDKVTGLLPFDISKLTKPKDEEEEKEKEQKKEMNDKMHEGGLDIALQVIGNLEKKDAPEIQPAIEWDLSGQSLDTILLPDEIKKVEVENIILSNNEFSNIPLDIMKIPSLSKIIIDHNKIDDIDFKAIKALRMHKEITYVDLSYNKLRAIPPELFSLPKTEFNTSGNPLAGGIVFPSWFFGATFGHHNRFVLGMIDIFFLLLATAIVVFGWLSRGSPSLRWIELGLLVSFYGLLLLGSLYFGIYGIPWTDSIFTARRATALAILATTIADANDDDGEDELDEDNSLAEGKAAIKAKLKEEGKELLEKAKEKLDDIKDDIKDKVKEIKGDLKEHLEPLKEHLDDAKNFAKEHLGKAKGILGFLQKHANTLAMFSVFAELPSLISVSLVPDLNFPEWINFFKWFVFKFTEFTSGYDFGFGLAVSVAILQRIALELSRNSTVGKYSAMVLAPLITTFSLPIFFQLSKSLICNYNLDYPGSATLDSYSDDETLNCFEGKHLIYASISLFTFLIYYPMAALSIPVWQQRSKGLTITFPSYFLIAVVQVKFMLTLITSFFQSQKAVYLTVNFLSAIILISLTGSLPTRNALTPELVLTKTKVKIARLASYTSVFLSAISAIIVYRINATSSAGLGVIIGLVVVQLIITVISVIVAKVATKKHTAKKSFPPFFYFTPEETKQYEEEMKKKKEEEELKGKEGKQEEKK